MLFDENWHRCGLFGKNSRLRCFVAIFIADVFTHFLCYFFGAKSALVLIFTLLESLLPAVVADAVVTAAVVGTAVVGTAVVGAAVVGTAVVGGWPG